MEGIRHLDLFSGIGGFALAVDTVWPGSEHIFCDNDLFCQEVLKKHWPNSKIYGDIRTLTADADGSGYIHRKSEKQPAKGHHEAQREPIPSPDASFILTGGFPCQPFSQAGRRKGTEDDRHLWPEMLRVIREFRPQWVIGENVAGFVTWNDGMVLRQVFADLEGEGYEIQAFTIPAVAVNAPHRRDRIWIVAHTKSGGGERRPKEIREKNGRQNRKLHTEFDSANSHVTNPKNRRGWGEGGEMGEEGKFTRNSEWSQNWLEVATRLCRVDARVSTWVDGRGKERNSRNPRLKALGNAIVPAVAVEIMKAIRLVEQSQV